MVRYWTPSSMAARTVRRTASTPMRCPAERGSPRLSRPAAVAVHDDGHVPRNRRAVAPGRGLIVLVHEASVTRETAGTAAIAMRGSATAVGCVHVALIPA